MSHREPTREECESQPREEPIEINGQVVFMHLRCAERIRRGDDHNICIVCEEICQSAS